MLDKKAEKILKRIIKKVDGDFNKAIEISHKDFKNANFTNKFIYSVCTQLHKDGYLSSAYVSHCERDCVVAYLSYNGYSYFETKHKETMLLLLKNVWLPIIVSLVTTLIIFGIEMLLKK
ncbi:MAG: hypothetical protein IKL46_02110 [Clostridia bacterium]|nr:hypothetical protein [Clostridia bacterium]